MESVIIGACWIESRTAFIQSLSFSLLRPKLGDVKPGWAGSGPGKAA